jgi:hypothetical protein
MTIKATVREQVRQRAHFACEFCGISEIDTGGQLTIDHFQPKKEGGDDSLDNLLYCCVRCNQYKLDYWPTCPDDASLWNPHCEPASEHFLELDDGTLYPLTAIGAFTLRRLRLNRPPLVDHRLRKRLLTRYRDLVKVLEQLLTQQSVLIEEQQELLKEQRQLLQLLLGDRR